MGSDQAIKQCPQCGGGTSAVAPMCQWCGRVDPDSPMGKQQASRKFWISTAIWLGIGAIACAALVVFLVGELIDSGSDAREWRCDVEGPSSEFCD